MSRLFCFGPVDSFHVHPESPRSGFACTWGLIEESASSTHAILDMCDTVPASKMWDH